MSLIDELLLVPTETASTPECFKLSLCPQLRAQIGNHYSFEIVSGTLESARVPISRSPNYGTPGGCAVPFAPLNGSGHML